MMVVFFHLEVLLPGQIGVDLFFVISGFIMGRIAIVESPVQFLWRKILRIVPLYWAVTLFMCAISFIPGLIRNLQFSREELLKSLFFIPYVKEDGNLFPLVVQGWTLNFETSFYLLFAGALLTCQPRYTAVIAIGLLVLAGLGIKLEDPVMQLATSTLILEFAGGLILAQVLDRIPRAIGFILLAIGLTGVVLVLAGLVLEGKGFRRVSLVGIPAVFLVAGALRLEQAG